LKYPLYLLRARQIDINTEYNIINSTYLTKKRQILLTSVCQFQSETIIFSLRQADKNSVRSCRESTFHRLIVRSNATNWWEYGQKINFIRRNL